MSQSRVPCPHCARAPGTPHDLDCPRQSPSLRRIVELELAKRGERLPQDRRRSYRTMLMQAGRRAQR